MSTDDEAQRQQERNIEWQRLRAEGAELMASVDRLLAERRDPSSLNIIPFVAPKKPPPPPEPYESDPHDRGIARSNSTSTQDT